MWTYRLGLEKAKRMLFTGDKVTGIKAGQMVLVLKSVPVSDLDSTLENLVTRMATVPVNQLMMSEFAIGLVVRLLLSSKQRPRWPAETRRRPRQSRHGV